MMARVVSASLMKSLFSRQNISDCYFQFVNSFPNHMRGYADLFRDKSGVEIGGPSKVFYRRLPVYQRARSIDGVNFSENTVWEGSIRAGHTYTYWKSKVGRQFIDEAADLKSVPSDTYDFFLSSNCLEHIANPLSALYEWKRVIKIGGIGVILVPNKHANFDHRRPYTAFNHLIEDFNRQTKENDLTHIPEIFSLHDLSMDPAAGSFEKFCQRSVENFANRCLHHHVFSLELLQTSVEFCGFKVIHAMSTKTDHWVFVSRQAH